MPKLDTINLDKLRSYVGNKESDIKEMIILFLQLIPEQKEKMLEAFKNKEWDKLNYIAHQLKPSMDIFGLNGSKEKARIIESLTKTGEETDLIKKFVSELSNELDEVCDGLRDLFSNL